MRGNYQLRTGQRSLTEIDVFADKSALVLEWILLRGRQMSSFQIREIASDTRVSLGLVQRVFRSLLQ